MIYFLSDFHGGDDIDGLKKYLSFCSENDLLILLGDMELNFRDTEKNREFTEYFMSLNCNIAFIDGNHENFDHLYSFPEEDWCGGRVHRLSDKIVHLMRGHIFELEGKSFFVMGGCESSQKWKDQGLFWPQENPDAKEVSFAYESLKKRGNKVDYVLTHKHCIDNNADKLTLEGLILYIEENVDYKHWYSGHWHKTLFPDSKHTVVFNEPIELK